MANSSARSFACAASGSQMATRRTRSPSLRQAVRWYQLIIPAPARATLCGACRFAFAIAFSSMSGFAYARSRAITRDDAHRDRHQPLVAWSRRDFIEVLRADAEQDLAVAVAPERIARPAGERQR